MIGLNLGCGPNYLKSDKMEWINTDLVTDHNFQPDQLWDFRKPIPLPDGSVGFILAWHILEHAALHERDGMVKDWYRVLKPGGKLAIAVPDIVDLYERYKKHEFDWYILMVNIYGPWNGFIGDLHRWGYNRDELAKVLKDGGFGRVDELGRHNVPEELKEFVESADGKAPPLVVLADWAVQFLCVK
jgi:predicted SAM-dependent methyltransferase